MKTPKLSIIIPIYNGEKYISHCLGSVFSLPLSTEELEVIVVDDCSTDNTLQLLNEYASKHSNMVVLHQEHNRRQGAARNRGIDIAKGEYIAFVDADDYIVSEGYINALNAVEKSHVNVCYFDSEYEYPLGVWNKIEMPKQIVNNIVDATYYLNLYYNVNCNASWRTIYRLVFLKKLNLPFVENVRWEDCDWTVRIYSKAKKIQFIEGVGYRYSHNTHSTSFLNDPHAVAEHIFAGYRLRKFAEEVKDTIPGLARTLHQEAKGHYTCEYLGRNALLVQGPSYLKEIYRLVDDSIWDYLKKYKWPKWVYMVIHYHKLSILMVRIFHLLKQV